MDEMRKVEISHMKKLEIGEWIKGPFANATIEGFVTGEDKDNYLITVKSIEEPIGELPDYLKVGSYFKVPKIVLHEFYRSLNEEQQENIILLAKHFNDYQWVMDLTDQFYNPFESIVSNSVTNAHVGSIIFNKYLNITDEEKTRLLEYYHLALKGHPNVQITSPEHITSNTIDAVIAAIVLLHDTPDAIAYVKEIIEKYKTPTL